LIRALAFFSDAPADLGSRFARLRWQRAVAAERTVEWAPGAMAAPAIGGADVWFVVADPAAVPLTGARVRGSALEPAPGRILVAQAAGPVDPPVAHSLRELEAARPAPATPEDGRAPIAIGFRTADFPAEPNETITNYFYRLLSFSAVRAADPAFLAVSLGDPSERERPELTRRLAAGTLRILDAGCGAGMGIAGAKARNPGWKVTGVEKDPRLASRARERCDRVLEGDLAEILPALESAGERFDAIVFADVLEHLEDPVAALTMGRLVAAPGAALLVSVPNVGHLSIVRDLVLGRFDPVPAGLTDAGHLRWFTRVFLEEALCESGWRVDAIESEAGAPPPRAQEFLALAAVWPDCDRESLMTYQWVATARAQ
jgi:SAM-dependent methyltransferase